MGLGRLAQGRADKRMQLLQVRRGLFWPGEDHRERHVVVVRMHQDTQQVQELFGRARAAREDDDAMAYAHKGFQAFFDIRQDHQFVDDRVWRFGGDDAGLGKAQVAPAGDTLFGVGNGRTLHRTFHHARAATGTYIKAAQAQFMPDFLGVFVFFGIDRVPTPAHHDLRLDSGPQRTRVAQQVEHVVGDALGGAQVDALAVQFVLGIDDVAQGAEQHLAGTGDHFAIHERVSRCVQQLQAHATILLMDAHLKVLVGVEDGLGVVDMSAGVEDCQGALAKKCIDAAGAGFAQLLDFTLRQRFEAALGADGGIDDLALRHSYSLKAQPPGDEQPVA